MLGGLRAALFVFASHNIQLQIPENKRKTPKTIEFSVFGGDKRDRTADLLNAMEEWVYKYEYLYTKWSK